MYVNKCIKCGAEFETKNPKRVICPNCLYSDKKYTEELSQEAANASSSQTMQPKRNSYSSSGDSREDYRPRNYDRNDYSERNDRGERPQYNRNSSQRYNNYNNDRPRDNRNGYQQNNGGYQRPYNNNRYRNDNGQRPRPSYNKQGSNNFSRQKPNRGKPQRPKQLLVSKEQIEQIEILYKKALPLPNPDIHELIGQAIGLEPRKVFFGINLVRQKLMLPKLPFPKRKLAVSPEQLFAIKNLYEPLLPLPPIGCHKIIAVQLRMDEWRVHVGIGLIRKQMGLDRWNQDREDAPAEYKKNK